MSAEKRPASDDPGAGQMLVKRQKPGTSTALARREGADSNSLIQSVCSVTGDGYSNYLPV